MHQVKGTFDVKVAPLPADPVGEAAGIGRMRLDKHFHGPLEATGIGEMLAQGDGRLYGAYVAIEKVDGELEGRKGTFGLVHHARMNDGVPEGWMVTVVPGSGSGGLAGLSGTMTIEIADGVHHYQFRYSLDQEGGPD